MPGGHSKGQDCDYQATAVDACGGGRMRSIPSGGNLADDWPKDGHDLAETRSDAGQGPSEVVG